MEYDDELMHRLVRVTPVITETDRICAQHRAWEKDQTYRKHFPPYRKNIPEWPEPDLSSLDPNDATGYWREFLIRRQRRKAQH